MSDPLVKRLHALDTCAVSDALDHLHLSGATTGVHPMWPGCPKKEHGYHTLQRKGD